MRLLLKLMILEALIKVFLAAIIALNPLFHHFLSLFLRALVLSWRLPIDFAYNFHQAR